MEQEQKQDSEAPQVKDHFTKVTPISRLLALVLFITFPFVGFWVGYKYSPENMADVDISEECPDSNESPNIEAQDDWPAYINRDFGFTFKYPPTWKISRIKDYKDGKNYIFPSVAGFDMRNPTSPLSIILENLENYDENVEIIYYTNTVEDIELKPEDSVNALKINDQLSVRQYEIAGAPVMGLNSNMHGTPSDSSLSVITHHGDLMMLGSNTSLKEVVHQIASTVSFYDTRLPVFSIVEFNITKDDLVKFFNDYYECSTHKESWQCFDENLNIAEKRPGSHPNIYDKTEYVEDRIYVSFDDLTGDGKNDATVMIYFDKTFDEYYERATFVLTRDFSITNDPVGDIAVLMKTEVGSRGQFSNGFTKIIPLEEWSDNTLYLNGPDFDKTPGIVMYGTQDRPNCEQLVWLPEEKRVRKEYIECK